MAANVFRKPQAITLVKRFECADYKVWNSDETNAKRSDVRLKLKKTFIKIIRPQIISARNALENAPPHLLLIFRLTMQSIG